MKIRQMTLVRSPKSQSRGFTLVEATAAILIGLSIAGVGLALVTQQVWFQQIISQQRFVAEDGPTTCNLLSRTLNKADRFLIYASSDDARSGTGAPVLEDGTAVVLYFRNVGSSSQPYSLSLIAQETVDGKTVLNFYHQDGSGWSDDPSWTISRNIESVDFSVENGILIATLTGPFGGVIKLAGSSQL